MPIWMKPAMLSVGSRPSSPSTKARFCAGPAGQPVGAPARGQRGIQERQADRAGGIGLFDQWRLVRRLGRKHHRHRQISLGELRDIPGRSVGVEARSLAEVGHPGAQPGQRGFGQHDEAPGLQLAMVGHPRGGGQDREQRGAVGHRGAQGPGRTRAPGQQEFERGGVGIGHGEVSFLPHVGPRGAPVKGERAARDAARAPQA